MGLYIYSVRTKSVTVEGIDAPVYSMRYLHKPYFSFEDKYAAMVTGRAEATWSRRDEEPRFVFLNYGSDNDKPYEGAEVVEWDGRAWDYDPEPGQGGYVRLVGFLRKVGRKWTVSPIKFEVSIATDIGPNAIRSERTETVFSRVEAEDIRVRAVMEGYDATSIVTFDADPDPELDRIVVENSAFRSFRDLLNAKGNYRPSIDVREPEKLILADAYDVAMERRGDDRRAFRYGTPEAKAARVRAN